MNKGLLSREQFSIIYKEVEQAGKLTDIGPLPLCSEGKVGTKNHLNCLSVDTAEPLEIFPTVYRHITTADNSNGYLQEDLPVRTASIGKYSAGNQFPKFHAQTALK